MVVLLVDQAADHNHHNRIKGTQDMEGQRRDRTFQYYHTEILDITINRVAQKHLLHQRRITIYRIEDSRQVVEQHRKYIIQIA